MLFIRFAFPLSLRFDEKRAEALVVLGLRAFAKAAARAVVAERLVDDLATAE